MAETIITIICSIVSLAVAIIVAVIQFNQGKRMEILTLRQDFEERKRREQYIKAQRDTFIMKYYNDNDEIYLLPLCWIASIYNPAFSYHRKMYMEFNMLEQDVQDAICKYMNFSITQPITKHADFYSQCIDAITKKENDYYVGQHTTLFYDNAKYLERCLERYNKENLPLPLYKLEKHITNLLCNFQKNVSICSDPIGQFAEDFNFSNAEENVACEICAVAAIWIAKWSRDTTAIEGKTYWIPGEYGYEELTTLEDIFLCALFCVYVNLILPNQGVPTNDRKTGKIRAEMP